MGVEEVGWAEIDMQCSIFKTNLTWSLFIKGILVGFVVCRKYLDKCNSKILRVRGFFIVLTVTQEPSSIGIYFS